MTVLIYSVLYETNLPYRLLRLPNDMIIQNILLAMASTLNFKIQLSLGRCVCYNILTVMTEIIFKCSFMLVHVPFTSCSYSLLIINNV